MNVSMNCYTTRLNQPPVLLNIEEIMIFKCKFKVSIQPGSEAYFACQRMAAVIFASCFQNDYRVFIPLKDNWCIYFALNGIITL